MIAGIDLPTYLVLIDVQEQFASAHLPSLHAGIERAIEWAEENEVPVVNVLFEDCGPLVIEVACALLDADVEVIHVQKSTMSAWPTLVEHEILEGRSRCFLCGVNTDVCVADTADDLSRNGHLVALIGDACDSHTHLRWEMQSMCPDEVILQLLSDVRHDGHEMELERQELFGRLTWLADLPDLLCESGRDDHEVCDPGVASGVVVV